jgi:release factor glutamine methyltransferase
MTVLEVLNWATARFKESQLQNPRLSAELLLAHSLNLSREGLYTRLKDPIGEGEKRVSEALINRRLSGEPLQYILGRQEFWSIDLKVDPRVLIPRPDTEILVEQALSVLSRISSKKPPGVLEIGTGSGAIAIAIAREIRKVFFVATDVSRKALILARQNAREAGASEKIAFIQGDLFQPFRCPEGKGPFDIILSNPPYIKKSEMEQLAREVKDFEPAIALNGGEDGFDFHRKIISEAPGYLKRDGWLFLEVGQGQAAGVSGMIGKTGNFLSLERIRDLSGIERVVKAQKK